MIVIHFRVFQVTWINQPVVNLILCYVFYWQLGHFQRGRGGGEWLQFTPSSLFVCFVYFSVLPLYVHIKSEKKTLSAEAVYDIHCVTFGSRPSALVTWWLGPNQLLDHSSQVSNKAPSLKVP